MKDLYGALLALLLVLLLGAVMQRPAYASSARIRLTISIAPTAQS